MTRTANGTATRADQQHRAAHVQAEAQAVYRQSVTDGAPLSGKALGERFGRSDRWGRQIIADLRRTGTDQADRGQADAVQAGRDNRPQNGNGQHGNDCSGKGVNGAASASYAVAASQPEAAEPAGVPAWIDPLARLSVACVAAATGLWSVDHLATVARLAGTLGWRAWLLPAAIDGLAATASLALYRAHRHNMRAGAVAWLALLVGIGASVAGNVVATYPELVALGPLKVAVGATPPLSLALSLHLLLHQTHTRPPTTTGGPR